jgi:hypothetical protein
MTLILDPWHPCNPWFFNNVFLTAQQRPIMFLMFGFRVDFPAGNAAFDRPKAN